MRVAAQSALRLKLLAEIFEFGLRQSTFEKSSRVHAWGRVPLEIDVVTRIAGFTSTAKEMIEGNFVKGGTAGERADVAADSATDMAWLSVRLFVGTNNHSHCVPANDTLDAAFGFSIAWIGRLLVGWNGVDVGRIGLDWDLHTISTGPIFQGFDEITDAICSFALVDVVE